MVKGKAPAEERNMWAHGLNPGRIEALCDGVFAIAMTILVLELSMDEEILAGIAMHGDYDLNHVFIGVYTYLMGFLILGIYWALHHYIFHFIKRSDGVLVWLNIFFLVFAALVPLATKVNQEYPESYTGFAFVMLTTIITFLWVLAMWQYATSGYRLVDRDIDMDNVSSVKSIIIIGSVIAFVVTVATYFVSWLGYLVFIPMVYVIVAIGYGHHRPFADATSK